MSRMNPLEGEFAAIVERAGAKESPAAEGASLIEMASRCCACGAQLTLEEMHWFDHGDGTATCTACETAWMEAMDARKNSGAGEMPPRP